MLGERKGARLIIRRIGLTLRGGTHTWDCNECGRRHTIDLDAEDRTLDRLPALVAH
jgi:hypothetical protein